jgi:hypothetical protein
MRRRTPASVSVGVALAACAGLASADGPTPTSPTGSDLDCPLAAPGPLLDAGHAGVKHYQGHLADPHRFVEHVEFTDGRRLDLRHEGCEYDVVVVTARLPATGGRPLDVRATYRAAARTLRALAGARPTSSFDVGRAATVLDQAAGAREAPELGALLPMTAGELPQQVSVTAWQLADGTAEVRVQLEWGPA